MAQSFIFGGNTGLSYDQIQKQRDIANELLRANMSTPQNVGEGLAAIGRALAAKAIDKRTTRADEANRAAYEAKRGDLFGAINGTLGGATPASYAPAPQPTAGEAVANDTMSVLGNFGGLEQQYGLPQGYLDRTYMIESGGNPNAQNPNSSAGGGFQFIDSTAKQYGLTDKTDLGASADAAARLAADNKAVLTQALGREPTAGELYLAHQQGGAGAAKLLANPNARAVDIVGPDAVALNGGNPNMTAGDFAGKWVQKFGGGAPAPQGQPPINPAILMQLAEIQGNPYASESDKAIANVLMGQVTQAMDPMRQMEMERTRLELDQMKNPQAELPADVVELQWRAENAGLVPGTPEYQDFIRTGGSGPLVDFSGANIGGEGQGVPQPQLGTIPQGFSAIPDPASPAGYRMVAIPGGPEDNSAKTEAAADAALTASDVVTTAANRALEAAGKRALGGFGQGVVSMLPWTDSAEVARNVGVLGSQATIETLTAMREASPTGGALGSVTEGELQILKQKSGALDPSSPTFERDLADYTLTLLETIHGVDTGREVFRQTWQGEIPGKLSRQQSAPEPQQSEDVPQGIDLEDWKYMTPEERALFK